MVAGQQPTNEPPPADGREAVAAVLRLLHPLDPPTSPKRAAFAAGLSVLALASRVLRSTCPEGCNAYNVAVRPGQTWVAPTLRNTSRAVTAFDGEDVTYHDKQRQHVVPVRGFLTWADRTGARPI